MRISMNVNIITRFNMCHCNYSTPMLCIFHGVYIYHTVVKCKKRKKKKKVYRYVYYLK